MKNTSINTEEERERIIKQTNSCYEIFKKHDMPNIQDTISELVSQISFYGTMTDYINRRTQDLSDGLLDRLSKVDGPLIHKLWSFYNENVYGNLYEDTAIIEFIQDFIDDYTWQKDNENEM